MVRVHDPGHHLQRRVQAPCLRGGRGPRLPRGRGSPRPAAELRAVEVGHQSARPLPGLGDRSRRQARLQETAQEDSAARRRVGVRPRAGFRRPARVGGRRPRGDKGQPQILQRRAALLGALGRDTALRRVRLDACTPTTWSRQVRQAPLLLLLQSQVQARSGLLSGDPHPPCGETRGPGMGRGSRLPRRAGEAAGGSEPQDRAGEK